MLPSDKRYQIFISSTFLDLKEERRAVMQSLLELDCIPAGMELFPADDEDSWELIKREIEQSDYYVLVIGGRYGSEDDHGVSFTEREFEHATKVGIPILAFVHSNPEEIPKSKTDGNDKAWEKLIAFIGKVRMAKTTKGWLNKHELGSVVASSLVKLAKRSPGTGWVRGDKAASPELMAELA